MIHQGGDFDQRLKAKLADLREARARSLPRRAQVWLALAPFWPRELARQGFPVDDQGLATGEAVDDAFERARRHLGAEPIPAHMPWEAAGLQLPPARRETVLDDLTRDAATRAAEELRHELAAVGRAMAEAGKEQLSYDPPLYRWVELARRADDEKAMIAELEQRVSRALAADSDARRLASPEALRWIESAQPLAALLGSRFEVARTRAKRRLELFYRRAHDNRRLANYYSRPELEQAFHRLLDDSEHWALHLIGVGGTGKTMFLRHLTAELAADDKLSLAVARIDFDYLNPDYPFRAPGLLLAGLAEELRLQGPGAERAFQRFTRQIDAIHQKIRGSLAGGRDRGPLMTVEDPELREAIHLFADALGALGKRPVLILDTCEELAKIRPDGTIPAAVQATFDVLEEVRQGFEGVRVVFSGRRQLPSRDYLRVHRLRGFSEREAEDFLSRYQVEGHTVRPDLYTPIRRLAFVEEASQDARYSPYDLDMYASWACADPTLDAAELAAAGVHHYVRERILGRLTPGLRRMFPALTLLGRFDRPMIETLFPDDDQLENYFKDLGRHETVQPDRTGSLEVWILDPVLRRRLLRYYQEEDRAPYLAARRHVAQVLRRETLDRPFSQLNPQYFAAALETLMDRPAAAADWWREVEARVLAEGEWNWAEEMIAVLLDEPALDPERPGENLRAAVEATRAAVLLHTSEVDRSSAWQEAWQHLSRHPRDSDTLEVLETRVRLARAGLEGIFAPDSVATDGDPKAPEDGDSTRSPFYFLIERCLPAIRRDRQVRAAAVAALEVHVEQLASAVASGEVKIPEPDPEALHLIENKDLVSAVGLLHEVMADGERDELGLFVTALRGRAYALTGASRSLTAGWLKPAEAVGIEPGIYLDWRPPDDLEARLWLERLQITSLPSPAMAAAVTDELRWTPADDLAMDGIHASRSIDADRLAAARLRRRQAQGPSKPAAQFPEIHQGVKASDEHLTAAPRCQAHRSVPPSAIVLAEARARAGLLNNEIQQLNRLARQLEEAGWPKVALRADRALARIKLRFRLLSERGQDLPSSVTDSDDPMDRELTAMALSLDDRPVPLDGLKTIQEGEALDLILPGPRAEADRALWRAERELVLDGDTQRYRDRLRRALDLYHEAEDPVSGLLVAIAIALAAARDVRRRGGDDDSRQQLDEALEKVRPIYRQVRGTFEAPLPTWDDLREPQPGVPPKDRLHLESFRLWRPWLIRLGTCLVVAREPEPGPFNADLVAWLETNYGSGLGKTPTLPIELRLLRSSLETPKEKSVPEPELPATKPQGIERDPVIRVAKGCFRFKDLGLVLLALTVLATFFGGAYYVFDYLFDRIPDWPAVTGNWQLSTWLLRLPASLKLLVSLYFLIGFYIWASRTRLIERFYRPLFNVSIGIQRTLSQGGPSAEVDTELMLPFLGTRQLGTGDPLPPEQRRYRLLLTEAPGEKLARQAAHFSSYLKTLDARAGFRLTISEDAAGAPWEAMLGLPPRQSERLSKLRFHFRRVVEPRKSIAHQPLTPPIGVLTLQPGASTSDQGRMIWGRDLTTRQRRRVEQSHVFQDAVTAAEIERSRQDVGVLHIRGTAVETSVGLRLALGADLVEATDSSLLLRPNEILERYPLLRLCIVQAPLHYGERRVDGDRRDAARMRRLGARLFAVGVPAVLIVPPIPEPISERLLAALARLLAAGPRRASTYLSGLVRELQEQIAAFGHPEPEAALEMSFDICLYVGDHLNLRHWYEKE